MPRRRHDTLPCNHTRQPGVDPRPWAAYQPRGRASTPKAVWLHTASKSIWAILHTQTRHRAPLEEVVVITVLIPRAWRRRFKTGLWWTPMDIPPDRLGRIIPGIAYAESAT